MKKIFALTVLLTLTLFMLNTHTSHAYEFLDQPNEYYVTSDLTINGIGDASALGTNWYYFELTFNRPVNNNRYLIFSEYPERMLFAPTDFNVIDAMFSFENTTLAYSENWLFYLGLATTFSVHVYYDGTLTEATDYLQDVIDYSIITWYSTNYSSQQNVINEFLQRYELYYYNLGYDAGETQGLINGELIGYNNGYPAGLAEGLTQGQIIGYANGYTAGEIQGLIDGELIGYENGQLDMFTNGSALYGYIESNAYDYGQGYNAGELAGDLDGYLQGQLDMFTNGSALYGYQMPNSYDYGKGYTAGSLKNVNAGVTTFMDDFGKWIVPAIVLVMLLGGFLSVRAIKRGE